MKNILLLLFLLFCSSTLLSSPTIWYVNCTATGTNTGLSWEDAFIDLQSAITVAQYGDHIWVAKGTYHPTQDGDREISFVLNNGVKWYGGFEGGESSLNQRDWELNETVLSGEIGNPDSLSDNSLHVVYSEAIDSITLIDGFIITKGYAKPDANIPQVTKNSIGGGILIYGKYAEFEIRPVVANCKIKANYAEKGGGGGFLDTGGENPLAQLASPKFLSVTFENNFSPISGGLGLEGSGQAGRPQIIDCKFINNTASTHRGGGLFYIYGSGTKALLLKNCLFQGNVAGYSGGGCVLKQNYFSLPIDIINCTFIDNEAEEGHGAAIVIDAFNTENFLRFDSCRFVGNQSVTTTIDCWNSSAHSRIEMDRCVFYDNDPQVISLRGRLIAKNCLFNENGYVPFVLSTDLDEGLDFINCAFLDNHTPGIEMFRLNFGESSGYFPEGPLRFRNCIFQNNRDTSSNYPLFISKTDADIEFDHCLINEPSFDSCQQMLNLFPVVGGTGEIFCNEGMLYNINAQFISQEIGDYRLHPCSPLRNAGINIPWDTLPAQTDLQGHVRIAEGIVDIGPYEVGEVALLSDSIQAVSCPGYDDGEVWLQSENTCDPAQYSVNGNPISSLPASDLPPGDYVFAVTDNLNRTDTIYITLEAPAPITAIAEVLDATAPAVADGQIWLGTVGGGTPPYTYLWSNGSTSDILSGLLPGIYSLTVTDVLECPAVFEWEVGFVDGTRDVDSNFNLNYWPNPAENTLWIRFDLNRPEAIQLRISDLSGKLLWEREEFCPSGSHLWKMPLENLAPGIYFAKLNQSVFRFVKN
ncbi:MAG: T9SS type A sorting domain-containing protein [Saprospiraceae bacterium]